MKRILKKHNSLFIVGAIWLVSLLACSNSDSNTSKSVSNAKLPDVSQAKSYSLLKSNVFLDQVNNTEFLVNADELKAMERRVIKVSFSSPEAKTLEQRAQTAMKAAIDVQKATNAHIVDLTLELDEALIGKGKPLVILHYFVDGKDYGGYGKKDTWEIDASGTEVPQEQVDVAKLWYRHREEFRGNDVLADEAKLKAFLAKKYGLKKEQIVLPYPSRDKYTPKFAN